MPDTTASYDASDPASWMGAATTRAALDSAPPRNTLPDSVLASDVPLPPPWPPFSHQGAGGPEPESALPPMSGSDGMDDGNGDDEDDDNEFAPRNPDDRATRPIFAPEQWVSDPDFWESKTHIALTGRRPVPRPKSLALTPPQRFHPMPRWRSALVLIVVCLLIAFTLIGVVQLARYGSQMLGPAHHTATPAATHTVVAPTATPHKKK